MVLSLISDITTNALQTLLAPNPRRIRAVIENTANIPLSISIGGVTASGLILGGERFEIPQGYYGPVEGAWESASGVTPGNAAVMETALNGGTVAFRATLKQGETKWAMLIDADDLVNYPHDSTGSLFVKRIEASVDKGDRVDSAAAVSAAIVRGFDLDGNALLTFIGGENYKDAVEQSVDVFSDMPYDLTIVDGLTPYTVTSGQVTFSMPTQGEMLDSPVKDLQGNTVQAPVSIGDLLFYADNDRVDGDQLTLRVYYEVR